ncbi:hypothetical protein SLEP1_g48788 [Rubroshorea leprosula]|uniref:Retrotransposon Copia-like N-terminal domain-containing protein n=1 Tax=Rubroshorea leprosula TaxID=152421 RepID=A0AAV5LVL9_9ROSI|nr:hypothetical protein SLEP1_g48788 [Rubroshorea leprosula]
MDSNSSSSENNAFNPNSAATVINNQRGPFSFNVAAFPLKLTPTNYLSWKSQFTCLLAGFELLSYLDGFHPSPIATEPSYTLKSVVDELGTIDRPLTDDDLTVYILNGLGLEFREIAASLRTRDSSLSFDDLHDRLVAHEESLRREELKADSSPITAHYASIPKSMSPSQLPMIGS